MIRSLNSEREIRRIVLFGSFLSSNHPQDVDIAIFQDSNKNYLQLAMKYRKIMRPISKYIPLDIIPLKTDGEMTAFLDEISRGEVIYER
ncbi:MAG: nucleotidyltransferase domain-containing protein [Candidatus Marinimicrobia bacterium]|nr:nucleotidyltransferase domain-containing protein [Candidatus Neomarinimicrobiota bacterium]